MKIANPDHVRIPSAAELRRAFDQLRLERVHKPAALAVEISANTARVPTLAAFVKLQTEPPSAFAHGVLLGLKIALLREQDAAHKMGE